MLNPTRRTFAALAGGIAVLMGAFGSHSLKMLLVSHQSLSIWHTAVEYHLLHALVLLFISNQERQHRIAYIAFITGIVLFSGSLYALALTGQAWLGIITPLGGVSWVVGWLGLCEWRSFK